MKSKIKKFLLPASLLALLLVFLQLPVAAAVAPSHPVSSKPAPVGGAWLVFAGKYGGDITKKEMEGQTKLAVEGCAKGASIHQFTLVVTRAGKTTTFKGTSAELTQAMLTSLRGLAVGDSFEFKEVRAYMAPNHEDIPVRAQKFTLAAKSA